MFIIMASKGEYSDREVWAAAVFSKEFRAEVEAIVVRKTLEQRTAIDAAILSGPMLLVPEVETYWIEELTEGCWQEK